MQRSAIASRISVDEEMHGQATPPAVEDSTIFSQSSITVDGLQRTSIDTSHPNYTRGYATSDSDERKERASRGWTTCLKEMEEHDQKLIAGWNQEIDTILIFAGLFSAVLTAFLATSMSQLQPDPMVNVAQILSATYTISNSNDTHRSPSVLPTPSSVFRATDSAIRINVLWFTSLVLSLATALFSSLVRQWLREYDWANFSVMESIRLRQCRFESLQRWGVFVFMNILPLLLQISVILFLVGLVDFLWTLNKILAVTVTSSIGVVFGVYAAFTVAPLFSPICPYKSPQAWLVYQSATAIYYVVRSFWQILQRLSSFLYSSPTIWNFRGGRAKVRAPTVNMNLRHAWHLRDLHWLRTQPLQADAFHARALGWLHLSSLREPVLNTTVPCMNDLLRDERVRFVMTVISKNTGFTVPQFIKLLRSYDDTADLVGDAMGKNLILLWAQPRGTRDRHLNMLLDVLPYARQLDPAIPRLDVLLLLRLMVSFQTVSRDIIRDRYWPTIVKHLCEPYSTYTWQEKAVVWSSIRRIMFWTELVRKEDLPDLLQCAANVGQSGVGSELDVMQSDESAAIRRCFEVASRTAVEALWSYRQANFDSMQPLPPSTRTAFERLLITQSAYLQTCSHRKIHVQCFPLIARQPRWCEMSLLSWTKEDHSLITIRFVEALEDCQELRLLPENHGHDGSNVLAEDILALRSIVSGSKRDI